MGSRQKSTTPGPAQWIVFIIASLSFQDVRCLEKERSTSGFGTGQRTSRAAEAENSQSMVLRNQALPSPAGWFSSGLLYFSQLELEIKCRPSCWILSFVPHPPPYSGPHCMLGAQVGFPVIYWKTIPQQHGRQGRTWLAA